MKFTQKQKVLKYLESHKRGITAIDGFTKFNPPITQIHTIISKLREDGYDIQCNMSKNKNTGSRFARWTLE